MRARCTRLPFPNLPCPGLPCPGAHVQGADAWPRKRQQLDVVLWQPAARQQLLHQTEVNGAHHVWVLPRGLDNGADGQRQFSGVAVFLHTESRLFKRCGHMAAGGFGGSSRKLRPIG